MVKLKQAPKALITGASSGIGAVYADRLARRGYDLILAARDIGRLEAKADELMASHDIVALAMQADLAIKADTRRVADLLHEDPSLSLLVNNAGVGPSGPVLPSSDAELSRMVTLNVDALHVLSIAAARAFSVRRQGAIINIASVVALMPEQFNATYAASKAFVLSLTQSLAEELRPTGVQIQAVLPGLTRTEIFERAGIDSATLPAGVVMDAGEMVDAALAGFDQGELVTIPSLADARLWEAFADARHQLAPHLSLDHAAARYGIRVAA